MVISKFLSSAVSNGKRIIKSLTYGSKSVRQSYECAPFGIDSNPVEGMRSIYAKTSVNGNSIVIGYINTNQVSKNGELRLFCTDEEGSEQGYIYMPNNGVIEVNGKDDFLVRFNKLEDGFNKLKDDHNSLLNSYNLHTHVTTATISATAVPGVISPTTSQAIASTASISAAKIENLKCS